MLACAAGTGARSVPAADSPAAGVRAGNAMACSTWKMNAVLFITIRDVML